MKNSTKEYLGLILAIYILFSQIFALYFLFLYGKDHSFLNTILIGPWVSEFKGLLFPFFA
jgi:hypothetical protein